MLEDMDVFVSPVETFEGFCERCGEELTSDHNPPYLIADDDDTSMVVCEDCHDAINDIATLPTLPAEG